jgi:hypothetical protein
MAYGGPAGRPGAKMAGQQDRFPISRIHVEMAEIVAR